MKCVVIPALLVMSLVPRASASVAIMGASTQNIVLKGIGANAAGNGQSEVTWGDCTYDGVTSTCVISGSFTGLGAGGTYSIVLTYPGNGITPYHWLSSSPGSDIMVGQFVRNASIVTVLAFANGPKVTYYDQTFNVHFTNPVCTGVAATACGPGQVGLNSGATLTGPASFTADVSPSIKSGGLVSAGSYGGFASIAPGSWIEVYGANLANTLGQTWATSDFVNGVTAPKALAGTTITIGGKAAFLDYVSHGQIDAQVPSDVPTGPQPVVVTTVGGNSVTYTVTVNAVQPGLLSPPSFALKGGQYLTALFPDGFTYVLPPGAIAGVAAARAKPGDTIVVYGVGFGPVIPDIPAGNIAQTSNQIFAFQAFIGGIPASVTYAGLAPNYVGLYQFDIVVPKVAAGDSVPFTFTLGGTAGSQNLVIAIGS